MADLIKVEVLGFPELAEGSAILAGRIDKAAHDQFKNVADQVASELQGRLPYLTGQLAGSVATGVMSDGAAVRMGDGVEYAEFVEYGGRGFPHSSEGNYLYPTAMAAEPLLVEAGTRAAEDEIGGMSWPSPG